MKSTTSLHFLIPLLFCLLLSVLSSPTPQQGLQLCPVTERGTLNFDDATPGFLSSYKDFTFPGAASWYIVTSSPSADSPIPIYKGVTSAPHGLLSSFTYMTWIRASTFTFDLLSLNITALTSAPRKKSSLSVKFMGVRPGLSDPLIKTLRVQNAYGWEGGPVTVQFDEGWTGLSRVGIEALEGKLVGVPKPGDLSPGFVLDDVEYAKRALC